MSVQPLTPRERIGTARRIFRERGGTRTQGETAYLAYLVVLVLAMVVVPLLIGLARVLARPEILAALQSDTSERVVLIVGGCLIAAASAVGIHRGPAHLPPVLTGTLAGTDLPRARTLLRPFLTATTGLTILCTVAGALLGTVLVTHGGHGVGDAIAFSAAGGCLGLISSTAWLAGQRIGPRHGWLLPVVILGATLLTVLLPTLSRATPWGWCAGLWPPSAEGPPWGLVPLVLLALVCVDRSPRLLNRIPGPVLLEQARRWEIVGTAAYTGDFSSALANFRVRPRLGRRWRAVAGVPAPVQYAVRDLVGAARTPVRALTGLGFLVLGGFLAALAAAGTAVPGWLLMSLGAGVTFAALGTFTDGFRHAAETDAAPTLFGYSTRRLFALHAALPALVAVASAMTGAALARLTGWPSASVAAAALLAVLLVSVRAFDSAKGPLPLTLLTPAPSPAGDMSGLMVLGWQADALLISIGLGVTLAAVATSAGLLAGAALTVLGILGLIALTRARLHPARG